jgi:hypothetical protein
MDQPAIWAPERYRYLSGPAGILHFLKDFCPIFLPGAIIPQESGSLALASGLLLYQQLLFT